MQPNPQPNLANLNQIFNQYDSDHNGKVDKQQIQSILKDIGYTDVYVGTIKKIIRLINLRDGQNECETLNFLQVEEYAEAMVTKGKFKIWKATLQNKVNIDEMVKELRGNQQNQAAPGASPSGAPGQKGPDHQHGQISINVGNLAQCPQFIRFFLEKQKGQQTKPYLRIVIERNSTQQAKQLQTSFKTIYDTMIEFLKVEQQALIDEILSVNFDTKVQGNVFTLNVSTQNQGLIELVEVFTESLDKLMNSSINGKIQGQYRFDFDFEKFISDPSYNFYDMFVKNSMFSLKWNVWDLFDGLRKFALKAELFDELKWNEKDPFLLFLIGMLHCEKFAGRLEFENTSTSNQEVESKKEIIEFFQQLRTGLGQAGEDMSLDFVKMIEHLEGKVFIEAGVKDWRFRIQAKVSGLSKVFVQEIKQVQEEQTHENVQQPHLNQNGLQQQNVTLNVTPPSSPKILNKSSSIKSLKKPKQ